MVELRNLSAGYGDGEVLHNISLTFPTGCVSVIVGPNGCGKSTLLKSMIGLIPHISGEILVDGMETSKLRSGELAQKIAYLPQNRRTPDMTAEQLVLHGRFPYLNYPRRYRQEDRRAARAALEALDILDIAKTPLPRLSGGTQQKCYIAMALAQNSPTILMDEPLSFLDISHQLRLLALARELAAQGKAPVLVLHDLALALRFAHRILVMDQGRIRETGTPEEILQSGALEEVFGVKVHQVNTPQGNQFFFTEQ